MKFLSAYRSIPNYLERFTILQLGKLHIRVHKLLSTDDTDYYHNHPFSYVSVPLRGSYVERYPDGTSKKVSLFNIAFRSHNTFHSIESMDGPVTTLFFTWRNNSGKWGFSNPKSTMNTGMYKRKINEKEVHCKFDKFWFIGNVCPLVAKLEYRPSIYQTVKGVTNV